MNKLIPFSRISKNKKELAGLSKSFVVVNEKGVPLGFVFGRDSFISFLELIDEEFETKVKNPKLAFNNPAGRLIDMIEEKLPVSKNFVKELKASISEAQIKGFISVNDITEALNV